MLSAPLHINLITPSSHMMVELLFFFYLNSKVYKTSISQSVPFIFTIFPILVVFLNSYPSYLAVSTNATSSGEGP